MYRYPYVGHVAPSKERAGGTPIYSIEALREWWRNLSLNEEDNEGWSTFVVTSDGVLRLAPRRSEHVDCAGGGEVLAAGEIRFENGKHSLYVAEISNLSTGYCPDPSCWTAVATALDHLDLDYPDGWTECYIFRACPACGQRNLVKDEFFFCELCEAPLPGEWNLG